MNVILFVTSFLMILSMMTYAKVEEFRSFMGFQSEFERYMASVEHRYANHSAEFWYDTTRAKRLKTNPPAQGTKTPIRPVNPSEETPEPYPKNSSPRLCFRYLVDEKMREKDPDGYTQTIQWAKKLMTTLYGNSTFFKEAEANNSSFLDGLFDAISRAASQLPQKQSLKHAEDLANLELWAPYQDSYYAMLKGCARQNPEMAKKTSLPSPSPYSVQMPQEEGEDDIDAGDEALEGLSVEGYDSLLNYVTLTNKPKIRVYLASRPILLALFEQPSIVEEIIQTRQNLYRSLMNGNLAPEEATNQFKGLFQGYLHGAGDRFVDFKVSKTNPKDYGI